jgi:hypothetical protein
VFAHACKLGLEGVMSKRAGRVYRSGTSRSLAEVEEPGLSAGVNTPRRMTRETPGRWSSVVRIGSCSLGEFPRRLRTD